jgi:hypothetical protein
VVIFVGLQLIIFPHLIIYQFIRTGADGLSGKLPGVADIFPLCLLNYGNLGAGFPVKVGHGECAGNPQGKLINDGDTISGEPGHGAGVVGIAVIGWPLAVIVDGKLNIL